MRWKIALSSAIAGIFLGFGTWHRLSLGQDELRFSAMGLRAQSIIAQRDAEEDFLVLAEEARSRAAIYESQIALQHLEKGMLVHRRFNGKAESECDSLLFSSLRYVALEKLGWRDQASRAWSSIETQAFDNGRWIRHPNCRRKSTSRDMIVGLMTALTQKPEHHEAHLRNLFGILDRTGGSLDDGPFYVSRLSPGIGELLKLMGQREGIRLEDLPGSVRIGFSTIEFDTWIAVPGYASHLNALTLWMELELLDENPGLKIRTLAQLFDRLFKPIAPLGLSEQRRVCAARSLAQLDPGNLFFEWLNLKASGALNFANRSRMLEKLLAMPQFPKDRLPTQCDRKADYLWQRGSFEYSAQKRCDERFHGSDFLWMTALLTEEKSGGGSLAAAERP